MGVNKRELRNVIHSESMVIICSDPQGDTLYLIVNNSYMSYDLQCAN